MEIKKRKSHNVRLYVESRGKRWEKEWEIPHFHYLCFLLSLSTTATSDNSFVVNFY